MGVAFRGHDAIASQLIATGCDINATNAMGQTALMMAAMFGRERQIELLLAEGADAGVVDLQGNTAASAPNHRTPRQRRCNPGAGWSESEI